MTHLTGYQRNKRLNRSDTWTLSRRQFIEIELDKLPEAYTPEIYEAKCELAYRHVYDHYFGPGQNTYEAVAA